MIRNAGSALKFIGLNHLVELRGKQISEYKIPTLSSNLNFT